MNENSLVRKAIGEILDGRYFIIPSYQRGYRWKGKQVEDLLNDLFSFAIKPEHKEQEFYCLQPIIVQKLSEDDKERYGCPSDKEAWEVVDGQQRLTTIYIILNYILKHVFNSDLDYISDEYGEDKQMFHLKYETRSNSEEFFTNINVDIKDAKEIDYAYILNAYKHVGEWFSNSNGARKIFERIPLEKRRINPSPKKFAGKVLDVLCSDPTVTGAPSVQFIWYELESDENTLSKKNAIDEFVRINNGKIALTNAELIKALFLQKKNFSTNDEDLKQIQIAMEWEQIENELHKDDFWYYIKKKEKKQDEIIANRIDYLFSIKYKANKWNSLLPAKENIDRLNTELSDKDRLFRFYNDRFEGKTDEELFSVIKEEWRDILKCFRTFQDWYNDAEVYNYIGYLSQCGYDMAMLYQHYDKEMVDSQVRSEFIDYLKGLVKNSLKGIKVVKEDDPEYPYGKILSSFDREHDGIYNALLFLNINLLNEMIVNMKKNKELDDIESSLNSAIYKFPFDIFVNQKWDIEHIDSFTTNPLKSKEDRLKWLETSLNGLDSQTLNDDKRTIIQGLMVNEKYEEAIKELRDAVEEEMDADEIEKNGIGNLTLLDNVTNRQYHNDLFVLKRAKIMKRLKEGIFVPTTTLYAFAKLYQENPKGLTKWKHADKVAYHNFIINSLKDYIGG